MFKIRNLDHIYQFCIATAEIKKNLMIMYL